MNDVHPSLFPIYLLALSLLVGLIVEALVKYKRFAWSLPALIIYATTFAWYFVEFIYTPESLSQFSTEIIENSYYQIVLFLISFRLLIPYFTRKSLQNSQLNWTSSEWNPERILLYLSIIWGLLLSYGIIRMNGDVLGALLPLQSRSGVNMWSRAAAGGAGATGFIVSTASYTYLLITSFFVVLLPLQRKKSSKLINGCLVMIALPFYFLMGARNQLLAVVMPGYFSYLLFSKQKRWFKVVVTILGFFLLNHILTLIIAYRNIGFDMLFAINDISLGDSAGQKHLGLNMLGELCHINTFFQNGKIQLSYGGRYLAEAVNIVPRAIWPNKPLVGINYAVLRGFGGSNNDIGVFATISTGFIGQGILNFGPWLGAVIPSALFAIWASWLARLWMQSYSTLRLCLFLAALGVTFNLGRDITLLVLFPIIFGYALVRLLEYIFRKNRLKKHIRYTSCHTHYSR